MNDCRDGSDEKSCPNEGNSSKAYKLENTSSQIMGSSTQHNITKYSGFSREWGMV